MHEYDGGFLLTLIGGLAGYDESLYREWLLNHPDERARAESESDSGLSFHGFTSGYESAVGYLQSGRLAGFRHIAVQGRQAS